MIDISDGLSTDLNHICEESGVGAEVWAKVIPRATVDKNNRPIDLKFAIHGGDDYELLFTAPPGARVPSEISGVPVTCIGEIKHDRKMSLISESGKRSALEPQGWQHFRNQ